MNFKILLTAINAKYIHSNLAVYSLRSFAVNRHEEYQDEIEIAEYTINQQLDEILMDLYRKKPNVLCLSCYIWNIQYIKQLIPEIHKILTNTDIWLGGPEVSYNAVKEMEEFPQIKGVMCGEGEVTFSELAEYYHGNGKELNEIAGICYRTGDKIIQAEPRPVTDLSAIPFVYKEIEKFKNKIIYYESSRGCPFSCSYCLSSIDKCLRFRDIELVKKELQFFIDNEIPQVKFVDRTFNCNHRHAMAIWKYLKEHDNGKTNFHFEVAADLLNEEEIALISIMRPGLIQLEIGVQSTNPETVKEIRRTMKFEKVSEVVKKIQSVGNIHQHLDLIAGLPYEDYESFRHSFNDVYALRPEQLQLGFLKVLKGSYMEEQAENYELVCQDRPPYEVLSTKWLPYEDVIRLKGVEEMVEVYYNSGQFVNTLELLEKEFVDAFSMFEALRDYYEEHQLNRINHTRIARYEILFDFALLKNSEKKEIYREKLTYDLYLRENVKNRPAFAGEPTVSKEEAAKIYEREAQTHEHLPDYSQYDKRQLRKMTHLEKVDGQIFLFDYQNRNKLTNQARVCLAK
ncbi:MAG: B12-binding domain-containing radical SAM protein [Schaedlerella sp.]|nr:B12-binding domain-containing radical SAM protein [Schaedlerella sp.]